MSRDISNQGASDHESLDNSRLYSIGFAARFSGLHPQTLRSYEKNGLIEPMRTPGNARRYTARDIEVLCRIKSLSQRGMSLDAMRTILALEKERQMLYELIDALESELAQLRAFARASRSQATPSVGFRSEQHTYKAYKTGPAASSG